MANVKNAGLIDFDLHKGSLQNCYMELTVIQTYNNAAF